MKENFNEIVSEEVKKRLKKVEKETYLLMFVTLLLGVLCTSAYYEFTKQPQIIQTTNEVVGLYTNNKFDFSGQWIHVKVDGMTYSQCVSVVQHECGHAFFAQLCQTHDEVCQQIEDYLANENGT